MFCKTTQRQNSVLFLPISAIFPPQNRPRRVYNGTEMALLTDSIRLYGVLQPLTVQRGNGNWILVTGERRLRAAKLAGLREVPCLPVTTECHSPDYLTLLEQLRRQDLHYIDRARGIARLMTDYGLSQQAAAVRLGLSQSAVANKLRLLRHPPEILARLRDSGLTERHGRALLQEKDPVRRRHLLERADAEGWTVAKLEENLPNPSVS